MFSPACLLLFGDANTLDAVWINLQIIPCTNIQQLGLHRDTALMSRTNGRLHYLVVEFQKNGVFKATQSRNHHESLVCVLA